MATVGSGKFVYEVNEAWAKPPAGMTFGQISSAAVDSQDRVYVFRRTDPPIVVFDREGNYLNSWGNGFTLFSHGIYIGRDDIIYLTDRDDHVCLKYTLDGKPLQILGTRGKHSDTGCEEEGGKVLRAGAPFNMPAGMVDSPSGDLYVSDGYRNCRVHRFSADGDLISSWGNPGKTAPNEMHVPHDLWVDSEGIVYVCDRDNERLQVFSASGDYLAMWTDMGRCTSIFMDTSETIYITELTGRLGIWDKQGNLLQRLEATAAHWISGDSHGDLYLSGASVPSVTKYVKRS